MTLPHALLFRTEELKKISENQRSGSVCPFRFDLLSAPPPLPKLASPMRIVSSVSYPDLPFSAVLDCLAFSF